MSKEFTSLIADYQNRKVKRIAAIYSETDPELRGEIDKQLGQRRYYASKSATKERIRELYHIRNHDLSFKRPLNTER